MPVSMDPQFEIKVGVIRRLSEECKDVEVHVPVVGACRQNFDLPRYLRRLGRSRLVIADLSYERPSCYYELGLADAIGTRTALVASPGTRVHQTGTLPVAYYHDIEEYTDIISRYLVEVS
jgi:hypothetical protein